MRDKIIMIGLTLSIGIAIGSGLAHLDRKYSSAPICADSWALDMTTDTWYNCRKV